jgi:hypothetical protein
LHDGIVVHHHHGLVVADVREFLADGGRKIEFSTFPVAGTVMRAARDRAIRLNQARAADARDVRNLLPQANGNRAAQVPQLSDDAAVQPLP